ncbi:hypothetical protein, partial, partial [Parasitella parasitica]
MMLYWPWVDEATDLENFDLPSVFEENRALILRNQREFSKLNKDELSMYYIGPFNSLFVDFHAIDNPSYDELQSSSVPFCVSTVNPFTVGGERLTRSSLDEDRDTFLICNTPHDQNMSFSYSFEPTAIKYVRPDILSAAAYLGLMASLNTKQRDIVSHVAVHARYGDSSPHNSLKLLITGVAGTGKSILISALFQTLTKLYDFQRDRDLSSVSVLLTGTTGK